MWWMFAVAALAEVPEGVRPALAPMDVQQQYDAWLTEQRRPSVALVCEVLWTDAVLLCYRVREGERRRWVTEADLAAWSVSRAELRATMEARAAATVAGPPPQVPIQGLAASYLQDADADGWSAAWLLRPEALSRALGVPPLLAAAPSDGVVVAWRPDGGPVDRVMAVGVREMFDQQRGGVSPVIHLWDGSRWSRFGQAIPPPPAP